MFQRLKLAWDALRGATLVKKKPVRAIEPLAPDWKTRPRTTLAKLRVGQALTAEDGFRDSVLRRRYEEFLGLSQRSMDAWALAAWHLENNGVPFEDVAEMPMSHVVIVAPVIWPANVAWWVSMSRIHTTDSMRLLMDQVIRGKLGPARRMRA